MCLTLLAWDFWQVGSCLFGSAFVVELYPDSVNTNFPVQKVGRVDKVAENRHGHVELGELVPGHGIKARIFHGTEKQGKEQEFYMVSSS